MLWLQALWLLLFSALSFFQSSVLASSSTSSQTIDIFYWPLSAASPAQPSKLAEISYDPITLQSSVRSYTPPSPTQSNNELLRVGLFTDQTRKHWVGSLSSFSVFSNSTIIPSLSLYLSPENEVYNVAVSPAALGTGGKNQKLNVEFVGSTPAPTPHLNRPIVVRQDGEEVEQVGEKSLLQKYGFTFPGR
ncbi:predicted protein [Uncinocarpus reesii 1704]|uniref:Uncharacterized protein n=1 Tax=Uncinocarpus reesii (strain UAMH 1704) TaxID=336963 RepID=C4JGS8_UNCRE|nr:uncharacterized protein UREG_02590 [Uncinocarpus reesii 1704]EEP77741.1 predicted protein [Uncinocarpus reesii 1704]